MYVVHTRPTPTRPTHASLVVEHTLKFRKQFELSVSIYVCILYIYLYDMLLFMMIYYGNTCLAENRMQCAKKRKKRNREQVEQQLRESFQILISRTYTLPANCNITKKQKEKKILRTGMNCSVYYIEIACAH